MDIRSIALDVTTISNIMEGRTKIATDEIITQFGGTITINDFDLINTHEEYYAYSFEEASDRYAYAGYVLAQIFGRIIKAYGSVEVARAQIAEEPLRVQLGRGKTKNGNTITTVRVI